MNTNTVWRRVTEVGEIVTMRGPIIYGDVRLVTQDCGHVAKLNPTMSHKVGDLRKCFDCEQAAEVQSCHNHGIGAA